MGPERHSIVCRASPSKKVTAGLSDSEDNFPQSNVKRAIFQGGVGGSTSSPEGGETTPSSEINPQESEGSSFLPPSQVTRSHSLLVNTLTF